MVKQFPFAYTHTRENGLWSINEKSLPLPHDFVIRDRALVSIPAGAFGGNHVHPRTEAFVSISKGLVLIWEDADGVRHETKMKTDDSLLLFVVDPMTPHVVVNQSSEPAYLYEVSDDIQHDVMPYNLLNS